MVRMDKGLGFLNKRHCEKTSFILWLGISGVAIWIIWPLLLGIVVTLNFITISSLAMVGFGVGGMLFYRIRNHKKPVWAVWKS